MVNCQTFQDRIDAGGTVGYVIIALGIIGVLLGLFKLFTIIMTTGAMRSTSQSPSRLVPVTRWPACSRLTKPIAHDSVEALEMKLDEQILKESPKIERFNDILKVLASVAPLARAARYSYRYDRDVYRDHDLRCR